MKYIKEAPFLDRHGTQVVLPLNLPAWNGMEQTREPTVGRLLYFLLEAYEPSTEFRITIGDMKDLVYPVLDVLERGPNKIGYYTFEDAHFAALKRIALFYAERLSGLGLAKHSPMIQAIFEGAGNSAGEGGKE